MDVVSVVLPVYNESACIRDAIAAILAFSKQHPSYYFTFVDDGSTDRTRHLIEQDIQQTSKIKLISYGDRQGKGLAVKTGIESASGDYICFIDGDLAYSLDHLEILVDKLQQFDVVIGCRNLAPVNLRDVKPVRRLSGAIFNLISRKILDLQFRDMQAGLKGFRKAAAIELFKHQKVTGFAFDAELLYLAKKKGYLIGEIPAFVSKQHQRKISKVNIFSDSIKMFISLLSIKYYHFRRYE